MLVYNRDGWRCARCGKDITYIQSSIQHRKARGMGGTKDEEINSPVSPMRKRHHRVSRVRGNPPGRSPRARVGRIPMG